jgi:hypothetical protein
LDNVDKLISRKDLIIAACKNITYKIPDSLYLSDITEDDLRNIIHSIKKKFTGSDGICSVVCSIHAYTTI